MNANKRESRKPRLESSAQTARRSSPKIISPDGSDSTSIAFAASGGGQRLAASQVRRWL
jgi:hypothetical protein